MSDYIGPDGRPVMAASPYITDGVINAAEASARLSVAAVEAGANWAMNNPEAIAGMAVAMAVCMFVPTAPIAAYVLGASETAVVSTATEAMIGGVIASGTEAFVTTTLKEIGSDRSVGDKLRAIAGATGASALTSIPASVVGANVTTIVGQFVARRPLAGRRRRRQGRRHRNRRARRIRRRAAGAHRPDAGRRITNQIGRGDRREIAVAATGIPIMQRAPRQFRRR